MAQEVTVVGKAEFDDLLKGLDRLQREVKDLEAEVGRVSGKPLKIPTDPAEQELKELRAELKRVESAYERALRGVNFARVIAETDKTEAATRRLARANQNLAARGKQLIRFSKDLPPELRKVATGLDKVEKEAEQAERAFRRLSASKKSVTGLVQSIGQLRTGVGALIAALGVRQLIRFGGALLSMAADAVEIRRSFDSLVPSLRGITGSTALAAESVEFLDAISRRLKISTSELVKPYIGLTAALRASNAELKTSDDVFEAIIESGAAFGKTTAEIGRALSATTQIVGKGVASLEEFRQQLSETIPNAIPALAKGLGVTIPEAIAKVSSGSLKGVAAVKALAVGLRELNREAAELQLETLGKNLDNLERVAEQVRVAFADGFAPALNTTVKEITAMETELIALSSLLGGVVGEVIERGTELALGFKDLGDTTEAEVGRALVVINGLSEAIRIATGLDLGEPFRKYVLDVTGLSASAEKAFKDIETAAKKAAIGTAETARETEERFRKSFQEIAKAAKASAGDRETIEAELVNAIAKLSEESVKVRENLNQLVVKAETASAEERIRVAKFATDELTKLEIALEQKRIETTEKFGEALKVAAAARIEIGRKATEENLRFFKEIAAGATELTAARIAASNNASTKIEQIELELSIKLAELQEQVLEKLKEAGADRVKIEKETRKKISDLQVGAADAIVKELERIAAASKKSADKRIADEKRIQAELDKSIDKLRQLTEEIAATGDEDGEGGGKIGQLVGLTKDLVDELEKAKAGFGDLFGDPGGTKDPGQFLEESFADAATLLGGVTDQLGFYTDQLQTAGGGTEKLRDFTEDLEDAIAKVRAEFESFGTTAKERLDIVLGGFEALVEQGQVTEESFRSFGTEIAEVLDTAGGSAERAAGQVGALGDKAKDLEGVGTAGEDAAEGIKKIGDEAKGTKTEVIELADGTRAIVNVAEELEEAGEKGAKGVKELGDAAKETAEPLKEVAAAVEKLQEPILDEDQATNLEAFGDAAATAREPVEQLAEPVERIAAGTLDLSVALPIVTRELVAITPELGKLLGLLREEPVDLAAIATQLQAISGPLAEIGLSLTTVTAAIVALPDPLAKVNESIGPLFELIRAAAEDGSIAQVGAGFKSIAEAAPKIPEPVETFVAALETLVKLREQVVTTLADTAIGLEEVGSEDLRSDLEDLGTKLADIAKAIGEAATKTGAWKEALDPLQGVLQGTVTEAGSLATALRDDLNPELDKTETEAGEAADEVGRLADEIGEAEQKVEKLGETMGTVSAQVVADFGAMTAAANEFTTAANAAAEAAAKINVPQS